MAVFSILRLQTRLLLAGTVVFAFACSTNGSQESREEQANESTSDAESEEARSDAEDEPETPDDEESCGNGKVDGSEECDDGDDDDQDGCTKLCEFTCINDKDCEDQNPCNGSESCTEEHTCESGTPLDDGVECGVRMWCHESECVESFCGDGVKQTDEECDDADRDDDDGCTSECLFTCVRHDSARDCASECNPTARCEPSSHVCSEGEPLRDGSLCDRGAGYCLSGVCVELDCENGTDVPPGLCESDDPPTDDAGVDETCGSDGPLSPGSYEQTVPDDRTFQFYIPESLDTSQKVPLVFVHHGFTMSGEDMKTITSWTEIANEAGIVVAFPDGEGTTWNVGDETVCSVGEAVNSSRSDDFGFVENMIDTIDRSICIDRTKVFTTGFSMGGYFTNNIACHRPNLVRAVAPHSGGMEIDAQCADPRPVLIVHGTADPLISYDCGLDARDQWARFNGCSSEVDVEEVMGGICERNRNCPVDAQVEMCSFEGMGHGWAGADNMLYGGGSEYEDAAQIIWRFFQEQMEN